ncbi:hypothetical protein TWF281_009231 [Arthrobotrys megalospora]
MSLEEFQKAFNQPEAARLGLSKPPELVVNEEEEMKGGLFNRGLSETKVVENGIRNLMTAAKRKLNPANGTPLPQALKDLRACLGEQSPEVLIKLTDNQSILDNVAHLNMEDDDTDNDFVRPISWGYFATLLSHPTRSELRDRYSGLFMWVTGVTIEESQKRHKEEYWVAVGTTVGPFGT